MKKTVGTKRSKDSNSSSGKSGRKDTKRKVRTTGKKSK